ncbi:hypothetical protein [Flavicella sediminum]|uniref:hypothetical protein n=1 Tax=Flavicella sediminum TaxID=2585141 RepID=UPI0011238203|nr:hypothetical protein [Flavicella sediminum]
MSTLEPALTKEDFQSILKVAARRIGLLFLFVFGLYFDGKGFAKIVPNNQFYLNILMITAFFILYYRSTPRTKKLMIYGVAIGFVGEHLFSRILGMYTYRLENVPLYVPFGHAAVYARVFIFAKASIIQKHHDKIVKFLSILVAIYATLFLIFLGDVFGFVMTLVIFLILWKRPKDRMFFLTMYTVVAVLEIGGTSYECWYWPTTAFDAFPFLKSYNPPSGISLFYYTLDIGCFVFYRLFNKQVWQRYTQIKKVTT